MAKKYTSKYPAVVTDKNVNSVNDSMIKKITVEEYYDLKHHTHSMSDLTTDEDGMSYTEMQDVINNLNNIIKEQSDVIQKLEADTTELKALIISQNETINVMKKEMDNMASIADWDALKPGNQDVEGNDLGTLMGFNMTEIK